MASKEGTDGFLWGPLRIINIIAQVIYRALALRLGLHGEPGPCVCGNRLRIREEGSDPEQLGEFPNQRGGAGSDRQRLEMGVGELVVKPVPGRGFPVLMHLPFEGRSKEQVPEFGGRYLSAQAKALLL